MFDGDVLLSFYFVRIILYVHCHCSFSREDSFLTQHADTLSDDGRHTILLKIYHLIKKRLGLSIRRSFFPRIYLPTRDVSDNSVVDNSLSLPLVLPLATNYNFNKGPADIF